MISILLNAFKGLGFLAIVIPVVGATLGIYISNAIYGIDKHPAVWVPTLCLSAVAVWVVGKKLNSAPERTLHDMGPGEVFSGNREKNQHTLFGVPMQWFAFFWGIGPILVLWRWWNNIPQ